MDLTKHVPFVRSKLSKSVALAAAALSVAAATPVVAQDNVNELEEVIVTGTHIRGTPVDTAAPVSVINRSELEDIGSPSVVEIIRNLGVSSGIDGEANQFGSNRLEGTSNINLRGLGAGRTLVLINGRRQVFSSVPIADQQMLFVDTNQIPSIAVQRLEVLKDGAAATYGSDAVAGVVNFITRDDFEGLEVTGSFKQIEDSDGDYDIGVIFGTGNESTRWVTSIGANHRSELTIPDRDFALKSFDQNPEGGWSLIGNPPTLFDAVQQGRLEAGLPPTAPLFVPDPGCTGVGGLVTPFPGGSVCRFQYTVFDNVVEDEDRFQIFSELNHDFSGDLSLHAEVLYARTEIDEWKTSPSYPPQVLVDPTRVVPAFAPGWQDMLAQFPALDPLDALGGVLYVGRVNGVAGPAQEGSREHETFRFATGLSGTIGGSLDFDAGLAYSTSTSDQATPDVQINKLSRALAGLGGPNCTGNVPGAGGCEFFNPFSNSIEFSQTTGQPNPIYNAAVANSPEIMDWLFDDLTEEDTTELITADFTVSGSTGWSLEGGDVGFAAGLQYRYETYERDPNDIADLTINPCPTPGDTGCQAQTGLFGFLSGTLPLDDDQDIISVFGELALPVTDNFNVQLALRYEDYGGDVGDTIDPKIAARWQINDQFALRGSASTTFRGPTLNQLGGTFTTLTFVSSASAFKAVESVGNPNLDPESATTFNVGVIANLFDDTVFATLDYWSFDFDDPIIVEPFDAVLATLPDQVITDGAGNIQRILTNIVNGPNIQTDGIDLAVKWNPDGMWELGFEATYINEYDVEAYRVDGVTVFESFSALGQLNSSSFVRPLPDLKAKFFAGVDFDQHNVNLVANYVASYDDERADDPASSVFGTGSAIGPNTRGATIDSHTTLDLNYNYRFPSGNTRVNLSINNLTDEDPPFARLDINYDPFTHNPLGRTFKVTVTHQFGAE